MISKRQIVSLIVALLALCTFSNPVYSYPYTVEYYVTPINSPQIGNLVIDEVQDIYDSCEFDNTGFLFNCTLDGSGNVWNSIHITTDLSMPHYFCVNLYDEGNGGVFYTSTCTSYNNYRHTLSSPSIYFKANNGFIADGYIHANGEGPTSGYAGTINIDAKDINVATNLEAIAGYCDDDDYECSSKRGGTIILDADNSIIVPSISVIGGYGDEDEGGGNGGYIRIRATSANINTLDASGREGDDGGGSGGRIDIDVDNLDVGSLLVKGIKGDYGGDGGSLYINSTDIDTGDISIQGGYSWDDWRSGGDGGTFILSASSVDVGNINAYGDYGDGRGGEGGYVSINCDSFSGGSVSVNGGRSTSESYGGKGGTFTLETKYLGTIGNIYASAGKSDNERRGMPGGYVKINTDNDFNPPQIIADGGESGDSEDDPAPAGGEGGRIILRTHGNMVVNNMLRAIGGEGGPGDDDVGDGNGGPGGVGGKIQLKAESIILNSDVYVTGGQGGAGVDSTAGIGGRGGTFILSADDFVLNGRIYAKGGNSGPGGFGDEGNDGGLGGRVSIYVNDSTLDTKFNGLISVRGGDGGYGEGWNDACRCGDGGDGGKFVLFSDGVSTLLPFTYVVATDTGIDIRGGTHATGGCEGVCGYNGDLGTKSISTKVVFSGFRMLTKIIEEVNGLNLGGSIQVRLIEFNTGDYKYSEITDDIWVERRSISDGVLLTSFDQFFGIFSNSITGDLKLELGKTYLIEMKISDDNVFDEDRCNAGLAECDTYYREFEHYYGI